MRMKARKSLGVLAWLFIIGGNLTARELQHHRCHKQELADNANHAGHRVCHTVFPDKDGRCVGIDQLFPGDERIFLLLPESIRMWPMSLVMFGLSLLAIEIFPGRKER